MIIKNGLKMALKLLLGILDGFLQNLKRGSKLRLLLLMSIIKDVNLRQEYDITEIKKII